MTKTKLLGESNKRTKLKVEISFDTPEHAEEAAFILAGFPMHSNNWAIQLARLIRNE